MKQFAIAALMFLMTSCYVKDTRDPYKLHQFKLGQIVHTKLDSRPGMVYWIRQGSDNIDYILIKRSTYDHYHEDRSGYEYDTYPEYEVQP